MPVPALRQDFVDQSPPEPEDLPAAEYNLNAERTDEAHDLATAATAALDDKADLAHTHTAANITDFNEAAQDAIAALLAEGTGVTLTYNDAANTLTVTGNLGDPETIRDIMGVALLGAGLINVAVNDAGDTITISTTATQNSTDAQLRDRTTHTGVQPISSVTDLQTTLDAKQPSFMTGTVATAAATAAKTVTLNAPWAAVAPIAGDLLLLTFTNGNTANAPTLAVNGGTARALRTPGGGTDAFSTLVAATGRVLFVYDGTYYQLIASNAFYNEITQAEIVNTASTGIRLISGRRAEDLMVNEATKARTLTGKTISGASNTITGLTSAAVTDFIEAAQDAAAAMLAQGTGITLNYNDAANTLTVTGTLGDPETIRDVMGVALVGAGLINIVVNDAGDTITFSTTATANATDAALRDRSTHTGAQLASTISDLPEAVQDIVGTFLADGTGIDVVYNDAGNVATINIANITTAMLSAATLVTEAEGIAANDNDITIPTSAAVKDAIDDAVGGASQIAVWGGYLGDGSAAGTDYTFNHGLNSRHVDPVYRDKVTGQKIIVDDFVTGLNTVRVEPDTLWALNRILVTVFAHTGMDVTAPTAPTVNEVSKTTTTIDVSATGSTDAVGVVWYRWWLDSVLVGEGAVNTFQFTGLSGSVEYDCGCTTLDLAGNESNLGVNPITTNAPASVEFVSIGTAQRSTTNGAQITIPHTVANVPNRWLLALVGVSNVSEAWGGWTDVDTKVLTSSLDGAMTLLDGVNVGPAGGQATGSMLLYGKQNPTVGAHNLGSNVDDGSFDNLLMGNSFLYSGVGSLGTIIKHEPYAAGNLALAVTGLAAGDRAFGAGVAYAAQFSAFNQTIRSAFGSAQTGGADFITAGDGTGTGTVNITATQANIRGGLGVRMIKAA